MPRILICVLSGFLLTVVNAVCLADPLGKVDVLFRNARVVDGSGRPSFRSDVAIQDGKIVAVGRLSEAAANATDVIDAGQLVLCPGFVDLHNHGDRGILNFREAENYVRQGVTTIVCGNCGSSPVDVILSSPKLFATGLGWTIATAWSLGLF